MTETVTALNANPTPTVGTLTAQPEPGRQAVADLRERIRGRVLFPGDREFPAAAQAWNTAVAQHPLAVVEVADAADVVALVRLARENGLVVSAQPGGHGATSALNGTLLVRTTALDEVWIDADAGVARVGAGVKWGQLLGALDGTGLIALAGSNPDVSVVGYLLGGGLSWFGRRYGVAAGALQAVEIVDGSGSHRWITEDSDPDLLWALRGGGGEFGIVTRVEIALQREPELHGGKLMFPIADSRAVLRAFAEVTSTAPDGLTCWASLMHFPDLPELPDPIRGRSFVVVDATWLGPGEVAEGLLAPIRAAGTLLSDSFGPVAISRLGDVAAEPTAPSPGIDWATTLATFDEATIDRLVGAAGDRGRTALAVLQVRHLGGALARPVPGADGAIAKVSSPYLVFTFGVAAVPQLVEPIRASIQAVVRACAPDSAGRIPLTFLGAQMPLTAVHDEATIERLKAVKQRVDPTQVIRGNHPLR